jgi:hypothetical protein
VLPGSRQLDITESPVQHQEADAEVLAWLKEKLPEYPTDDFTEQSIKPSSEHHILDALWR